MWRALPPAKSASLDLISWVGRQRRKRGGGGRAQTSTGVAETAGVNPGSGPYYPWQPGSFRSTLRAKVLRGKGRAFVQGLNVMVYVGNICCTERVICIRPYSRPQVLVVNKTMYDSLPQAHI